LIKKIFSGYRTGKPGLEKVLGSLESEVMEVIWLKEAEVSVRDVYEALALKREIAYTTVMTIMGRLAEKKLLKKRKEGNAFLFIPAIAKDEFTSQMVENVVDDLLADFSDVALASFISRVGKKDRESIEKLEKMLKTAREETDGDLG